MNKQIIIFSENSDNSTIDIMKWLKVKGYNVCRINSDDKNLQVSIFENIVNISTSFDKFSIDKNSICWFRRAEYASVYINSQTDIEQEKSTFRFLEKRQTFNSLKSWIINNCQCYSEFYGDKFNKIDVLIKAQKIGIKVAEWLVTNNKDTAISFAKKYEYIAVKPFHSFFFNDENFVYKNLTEKLTYIDIQQFSQNFVPRIFQQYIDKKYELRSFYFDGNFFTYAILSQNNPNTIIDFRNYDEDNPNRCVPFNLPPEYCEKLILLMQKLELDTGSFDILIDKNDVYYFLEVNPVGQFGYGSYQCNFNIEEFIANKIINLI
jgi:ATP-GRASP peptide maturase of grasp-with-spasm system